MAVRYYYLPFHIDHFIRQADEDVNTSETLFNTLYDLTPEAMLPRPSLADSLVKPAVSKARNYIALLIETADLDFTDFYARYKDARADEPWIQELKAKRAGKNMFRDAWANEVRTNPSYWGDVNIIAIWTQATKTMVNLVDNTFHFIYRIAPTEEGDSLPEKDDHEEWRCVYIMLESPTSCELHKCDITDADGNVVYPEAIFSHKGNTEEWVELMKRLDHDEWSGALHDVDTVMKQSTAASQLSMSSNVSTTEKKPAPAIKKVTALASEETIKNPLTGRTVKVGSKTYLALVKAGTIQAV